MDIDSRAFGQLEGEVKGLALTLEAQNKTLHAQNETLAAMGRELTSIRTTLAEAKGGWRTLMWLSGSSAALAGGAAWFFQHFTTRPG